MNIERKTGQETIFRIIQMFLYNTDIQKISEIFSKLYRKRGYLFKKGGINRWKL